MSHALSASYGTGFECYAVQPARGAHLWRFVDVVALREQRVRALRVVPVVDELAQLEDGLPPAELLLDLLALLAAQPQVLGQQLVLRGLPLPLKPLHL